MTEPVIKLYFDRQQKEYCRCDVVSRKNYDSQAITTSRELIKEESWRSKSYPILLICHLLTNGPSCFLLPHSNNPYDLSIFDKKHKECLQENKAIIIKLSNPREQHYFLVPLEGNNSKGRVPVLGVFGVSVSCCRFLVDTVLKKRRLPVVFDLDETLVHACSCSILREMGKKPEEGKETANRNGSATDEKDLNLQLVELRLKRVETDRGLLESFMMQAQVSTKTEVLRQQYAETHQYAVAENGTISYLGHIKRPYIKVDDLVLVRINPQDIGTSILIRLRPHWKSAMQLLTGERTPTGESIERPTPIIEAFICTAAQFDYAQEAWRLLDEGGQLVGYRLWPERIKTVRHPTQKTLAHSLSINDAGCTGRVMPFALVLDDQIEPWVSAERDQVFQVPQWNYHKRDHLVRSSFGLGQMVDFESQEMQSIGNIIYEIHKAVFSIIEEKIMPVLDGQNTLPHRLNINTMDEEYSQYLPESPWVSKLLPKVLKDFPLPKLSSCLVPRQVAAPVAALIEPQDPRVIRSFKVTPVKQPRNQTNGTEEEKSSEGGANKRRRLDLSSQPADNGKATIVGDSKALDGAIKEAAPSVPAVGKTAANAAVDRIPPLADTLQGKKEVEPITPVAILDALEKLHRQYPRDRNSYSIRELPCANSGVKIAIELRGEVEAVGQAESYWEAKRIAASNLYRALNNGT